MNVRTKAKKIQEEKIEKESQKKHESTIANKKIKEAESAKKNRRGSVNKWNQKMLIEQKIKEAQSAKKNRRRWVKESNQKILIEQKWNKLPSN